MVTAISIQGTTLSYKTTGSTFTEVDGVLTFPALGQKPEKVDMTPIHSDGYYHYRPAALKDFGDMDFQCLYDNKTETSNYRVLKKMQDDGTEASWEIKYPDNTAHVFTASCAVVMDEGSDKDGNITFTLTLYPSSGVTTTNPQ